MYLARDYQKIQRKSRYGGDTNDPYDYLRIDTYEDQQYAIFGGDDVKTGQEEDADAVFTKLQTRLRIFVVTASPSARPAQ